MKTAGKSASPAEARRAPRKTLRTLGEIVLAGRSERIECTVLDLSGTGARLKIGNGARKAFTPAFNLPDTFALLIPRDNIAMDCRLAWREDDMIGVAFASAFRPIKAPPARKRT